MPLNTIMYHYVRNNDDYEYNTFGRRVDEFYSQIEFFKKDSLVIDPNDIEQVLFYLSSDSNYAYLLTFDDGYLDHFYCAKFLFANNLSALFFPPQKIFDKQILSVNLIHLIVGNRIYSSEEILEKIIFYLKEKDIKIKFKKGSISIEKYLENYQEINPLIFDSRNNLIIKRLLQRDINSSIVRSNLIDYLFKKIYKTSPEEYLKNFYLSKDDLKEMKRMRMCFGSHGVSHEWMSGTSPISQKDEIDVSYNFLENQLGLSTNSHRIFCYPYGSYSEETLKLLNKYKVKLGFTTEMGESFINPNEQFSNLLLKRWDTNNYWDNKYKKPCINKN